MKYIINKETKKQKDPPRLSFIKILQNKKIPKSQILKF